MSRAREIIAHPADIIAQDIRKFSRIEGGRVGELAILHLQKAGFRILGPAEIDDVTVEACAKVGVEWANGELGDKGIWEAIRSLATGGQDE